MVIYKSQGLDDHPSMWSKGTELPIPGLTSHSFPGTQLIWSPETHRISDPPKNPGPFFLGIPNPIGSMMLPYMVTKMGYIDGVHVTIYGSTMDPSWECKIQNPKLLWMASLETVQWFNRSVFPRNLQVSTAWPTISWPKSCLWHDGPDGGIRNINGKRLVATEKVLGQQTGNKMGIEWELNNQ